jgi:hypothetical protein
MDFSLRVNRKQIATNSSPYRDQQFQHICSLRTRFQRQVLPIVTVDIKKREMIGNFKNDGAKWDRSPVLVNDHDFLTDASGVGISYGIYDSPNNRGTVCVGVSPDTPAFAAHSIATWWKCEGTRRYGRAPKLAPGRLRRQQQLRLLGLEDRTILPVLPNGIPSAPKLACS